ncbi:MAG: MBL fold metallo-hydrolase, partial [Opitutales bacterium]
SDRISRKCVLKGRGPGACFRIMLIESQELPPIGTNAYLVVEPERKACVVIDAPQEGYNWAKTVAERHDCALEALVLTHGHWDHTLDAHAFEAAGIPVWGHPDDRVLFEKPGVMSYFAMPGLEMKPVHIDNWCVGGDTLNLLGKTWHVRHVPGHCPGNILLYLESEGLAFGGDIIFAGSVGRYDLPGGDLKTLETSIREQVYSLPEATTIYTGHGPPTTVGEEKRNNPVVRA